MDYDNLKELAKKLDYDNITTSEIKKQLKTTLEEFFPSLEIL